MEPVLPHAHCGVNYHDVGGMASRLRLIIQVSPQGKSICFSLRINGKTANLFKNKMPNDTKNVKDCNDELENRDTNTGMLQRKSFGSLTMMLSFHHPMHMVRPLWQHTDHRLPALRVPCCQRH